MDTTEWLHFHFSFSCIGEGNGNPLQCSCLENPRDGGAWWAVVYGVAQSRTRLKRLSSSSSGIWYKYCYPDLLFLFHFHGTPFYIPLLSVFMSLDLKYSIVGRIIYASYDYLFVAIQTFCVFWLEHLVHLLSKWLLVSTYLLPFYSLFWLHFYSCFLSSLAFFLSDLMIIFSIVLDFFLFGVHLDFCHYHEVYI